MTDYSLSALSKLSKYLQLNNDSAWIYQVFLVVLLTLLASYVAKKALHKISLTTQKTKTFWDDLILTAAWKPLRMFILLSGFLIAADIARNVSNSPIFGFIEPTREVSFIVIFAWFMTSLIRQGEKKVQSAKHVKKPLDATTASALGKLFRLSILITTALVVLQTLGFSVSGVLAFGGVGGIAVGFAAKDLLSNFFGGLMLYIDQPFRVGDWVRSPDKSIEGTVESIGWRLTKIRTFDKRPLYVPNATFATISVENPSRMTNRRIYETIGVRYDDAAALKKIVADVKQMLLSHEAIDTSQTLIVNVVKFSESSIDFFIYTFTKTTDWIEYHAIKEDVMLKVINIVESHNAEFAFPTQTLHIDSAEALPNISPSQ